jgi:hypothetical protein
VATKEKYRLLCGIHYETNPNYQGKDRHHPERVIQYKKDDIIESERELDKVYVNKFAKLIPDENRPTVVVTDFRRQAVSQLISQGSVQEEDRDFLQHLPDENFARMQRMLAKSADIPKKPSSLGEDVTDTFQRAYDEGFKVFRNAAGKHQVCRSPNIDKPLNLKPLNQNEVEKFVADYMKG